MKLDDYNLMSDEEQYVYWLGRSVPVAKYENPIMLRVLYQLDSFYIEISFLKNAPEESYFIAFANTDLLSRYLVDIDISEIAA